jgi:hypothetical protein
MSTREKVLSKMGQKYYDILEKLILSAKKRILVMVAPIILLI